MRSLPVIRYDQPDPIVLMGGAYGNLSTLRACLEHARRQGGGLFVFLGDATGFCGHSGEALELIKNNFDIVIAGNHEQQAVAGSLKCGCNYDDASDEKYGCKAHEYAMQTIDENMKSYMAGWPDAAILEVAGARVLLCHGSPNKTNEFLFESQLDDGRLTRWLEQFRARGFICTHSGFPWIRYLSAGRFALNAGVIGRSDHDGDPAVHYAILRRRLDGHFEATIERVEYDAAAWADQLEREGVEKIYTEPLRTGWWTAGTNSLPPVERARMPGELQKPMLDTSALKRIHVSLHAMNLAQSIKFYQAAFDAPPVAGQDDWCTFMLDNPPLVLAVKTAPKVEAGGQVHRLGVRFKTAQPVLELGNRLEAAGYQVMLENIPDNGACGKQTKLSVTDPNAVTWLFYAIEEPVQSGDNMST